MTKQSARINVGISSCLLGVNVRYDGGHRKDADLIEQLGNLFEWVSVCPEVGAGMSVPREPVDLFAPEDSPRMIGQDTGEDWTDRMNLFARQTVERLVSDGVCGFILKSRSPSCGKSSTEILSASRESLAVGSGLFAKALAMFAPKLPVEEDETLHDPVALAKFLEAVRTYAASRAV